MSESLTTQQILHTFSKVIDQKVEKRLEEARRLVDAYSTREDADSQDTFLRFIEAIMAGYMKAGAEIIVRTLEEHHMFCVERVVPDECTE